MAVQLFVERAIERIAIANREALFVLLESTAAVDKNERWLGQRLPVVQRPNQAQRFGLRVLVKISRNRN